MLLVFTSHVNHAPVELINRGHLSMLQGLFKSKSLLVLQDTLLGDSCVLDSTAVTSSAPPVTGRRPKSVPVHMNRRQDQVRGVKPLFTVIFCIYKYLY